MIALVGKAYSTVRVPEFCALMGKSEAEVRQSKLLVCICLLSDVVCKVLHYAVNNTTTYSCAIMQYCTGQGYTVS